MVEATEGEEFEVGMDGEVGHASEPDSLTTVGVTTCIAVAVLDNSQRQAWLIHAPTFAHEINNLGNMLDHACEEAMGGSGLRVEVFGGSLTDPDSAPDVRMARAAVMGMLNAKVPAATIVERWQAEEDIRLIWEADGWQARDLYG